MAFKRLLHHGAEGGSGAAVFTEADNGEDRSDPPRPPVDRDHPPAAFQDVIDVVISVGPAALQGVGQDRSSLQGDWRVPRRCPLAFGLSLPFRNGHDE